MKIQIIKQSYPQISRNYVSVLFIAALIVLGSSRVDAGGNHLDYSFSSDGKVQTAFGTIINPSNDIANAVAVQSNGKIVVAGYGGTGYDFAVARYNSDGTLDTTFGGDGKVTTGVSPYDEARALVIQSDDKIVIAGYTAGDFAVLRYNANGTLDSTFSSDGIATIDFFGFADLAEGLTLQSDGKIVVVGIVNTTSTGENKNWGVARLNTNGTLDTSFDGNGILATDFNGGNDNARDVLVQSDGKIVVAGDADGSSITGTDFAVARYLTNGALDATFHFDGKATLNVGDGFSDDVLQGLARASDGKYVLAGGMENSSGSVTAVALVRLTSGGLPDAAFSGDGKVITDVHPTHRDSATDVVLQGDNKIVTTFQQGQNGPSNTFGLLRHNTDGSLDPTFGTGGKVRMIVGTGEARRSFNGVAFQSNQFSPDKIIAAGSYQPNEDDDFDFMVGRFRLEYSAAPADHSGDGQADYAIFRPGTGVTWMLNSKTGANSAAQFGAAGDVPVPGDYDRDGKTDIAIYRPSEGVWYILRSSNISYYAAPFGLSTDKPTQGDYDGDGHTDLAVFRSSTGTWYINYSLNGDIASAQFGIAEDKPAQADFDGDGLTDLAVFRPSTGIWYQQRSNAGFRSIQFGASGDRPVPADFDSDGRSDVAVWRPSTGVWYTIHSQTNLNAVVQFGTAGDIPGPADMDGDGKADLTVFRPSTGVWYVQKSTGGYHSVGFGVNGDIPLHSTYVPQ